MSPEAFNERLRSLPPVTERVNVTFRTAFGYPPTVLDFPVPAPVKPFDDPTTYHPGTLFTRVELRFPSGAIYRCSCHDITALEPISA
jgi:hypothetical protein